MSRNGWFWVAFIVAMLSFLLEVVLPRNLSEAATPDNYASYYRPMLFFIAVFSAPYLIDFKVIATLKDPAVVRGYAMFALTLYIFITLLVALALYGMFDTGDPTKTLDSLTARAMARSSEAFWATLALISSTVPVIAAYNIVVHRRETAVARNA